MRRSQRTPRLIAILPLIGLLLAACGGPGPAGQATPTASATAGPRPASLFLTPPPTPGPIVFPRDDAPHNDLTEWWYYTGHLQSADGRRYGFEFVIFQVRRGDLPPTYFSHFAVTDISRASFRYDDRAQTAGQPPDTGIPAMLNVGSWRLVLGGGNDQVRADMPGYALDIQLNSTKPPALHNRVGYLEFAPGAGSYYYSRTNLVVTGTLTVDGQPSQVTGLAWFDHQWGNFLTASRGGWDWFAIQLDDGRELMLWHTRDAEGRIIYANATLVAPDGSTRSLDGNVFTIKATGSWTSPKSGATYPSGWTIDVPGDDLYLTLTPVLKDQELLTPHSTRVTYWEGDVDVTGTSRGAPIRGQSYVELTGYAKAEQ